MKRFASFIGMGFVALASQAALGHVDILVGLDGGKVVTRGYDFDAAPGDEVVPAIMRVYGYDFGEIPGQPHFTEDPGVVALANTFTAGTNFSFAILDDLKIWTGSGFGAVPSGESLLIEKGSQSVTIGTSEVTPKPGFVFGSASGVLSGLQLHEHLDATLLGLNGNDTPPPANGIYLLNIALQATGASDSDPIWIVYNHGLDEEDHDAAIAWVEANLVPEPSALVLLGGGAVALLRRRR